MTAKEKKAKKNKKKEVKLTGKQLFMQDPELWKIEDDDELQDGEGQGENLGGPVKEEKQSGDSSNINMKNGKSDNGDGSGQVSGGTD